MAGNSTRQLLLSLQLGTSSEQLEPVRIEAYESLSEHFTVVVQALALAEIKLLDNLGLPAAISIVNDGEFCRYFHGIVVDACFLHEVEHRGFLYQLTLAPTAHFHEQGSNFRIYQGKRVIEIIKDVLDRCKIDFTTKIITGNRKLSYCVQYGESDFAFVCRLMEEEGLYYYYKHEAGTHKLVICDRPGSHADMSPGTFTYNPGSRSVSQVDSRGRLSPDLTLVQSWQERATSGAESRVTMRDFNFMYPSWVEGRYEDLPAHEDDRIEVYRWPGRYYEESTGDALSQVLLESRRAQRLRYEAKTQFPGMQTGKLFTLKKHPNGSFNRRYMLTGCRTYIANESYRSGQGGGETAVDFTAIPDDVQFRAPIVTPRPAAKGPETAIVVGPPGEEIHVDEYGRIKVQFHWDRLGKLNDRSSCWIRVSQTGHLGSIVIPRIGHEVLIDFINGNPDRPIVVGRVYNAGHMPHYKLPADKTKALIRSKTYKRDQGDPIPGAKPLDTGAPGANELCFEDATGKEQVYLHAEKDMKTRIRNDETHKVGHDVDVYVGNNRKTRVDVNDSLDVGQKIKITAGDTIDISAVNRITLQVGDTKITLDKTSIKTISKLLQQKASGKALLTSSNTKVEGTASLVAKGGIVKIN